MTTAWSRIITKRIGIVHSRILVREEECEEGRLGSCRLGENLQRMMRSMLA